MTIAVQGLCTSGTLEPARETSNVATRIFGLLCDNLPDSDRQGNLTLRPGIVESRRHMHGRKLEMRLRRGVRFHDSEEMTAEDVVFSFGPLRPWGNSRAGMLEGLDPALRAYAAQVPGDLIL